MLKRYFVPVLCSLIIGYFLGNFLINQYDDKKDLSVFFNNSDKLYFFQQGVYSSEDSMKENMSSFSHYIYMIENDKYYVYVGITKDEQNIPKIKGYYEDLGYTTYVKEFSISNEKFITVLEQYDILLKETEEKSVVGAVCGQVLGKYEELVVNVNN